MNEHSISSVAIIPNLDKPEVHLVVAELIDWLDKRSITPRFSRADAQRYGRPEWGVDDEVLLDSSFAVCLGGDGTILRGVRLLKGAQVPLVGVNFGRVGFLSEVEVDEMYDALERILAGTHTIDERMLLKCTIEADGQQQHYLALNEVSIERGNYQRMLELDVHINGSFFSTYTSDGLIFATPTGSTAYSFSVGGPIVHPGINVILLSPINPHSLFGRTMLLQESDFVEVKPTKKIDFLTGIDGYGVATHSFDSITIQKAREKALLIKLKERSFYTLFKEKLRVWDTWLR